VCDWAGFVASKKSPGSASSAYGLAVLIQENGGKRRQPEEQGEESVPLPAKGNPAIGLDARPRPLTRTALRFTGEASNSTPAA
jgi:hypothetical protein